MVARVGQHLLHLFLELLHHCRRNQRGSALGKKWARESASDAHTCASDSEAERFELNCFKLNYLKVDPL